MTEIKFIAKGRHAVIGGDRETIKKIWEILKEIIEEDEEENE